MTMKWWEKTVEYYFILKYLGDSISIAPLDGHEERGGDAILSSKHRWILIEFKKDKKSLGAEQYKFNNYSSAKERLSDSDSHHFVVYGFINNQVNPRKFALTGQTYFSEKRIESVTEMLKKGKTKTEFLAYLDKLMNLKKASDTSGSGGLGLESYSLVAGINSKGEVAQCMSLYDLGLGLEQVRQQELTVDRGFER